MTETEKKLLEEVEDLCAVFLNKQLSKEPWKVTLARFIRIRRLARGIYWEDKHKKWAASERRRRKKGS